LIRVAWRHTRLPGLRDGRLHWQPLPRDSGDAGVLRPAARPFSETGGLRLLQGNLGRSVIKTSAVPDHCHVIEAPARVFDSQQALLAACNAGELERDVVAVVRFQGPRANGMPELHKLTPPLAVLQGKGFRVALVTDGRMSGASGKVPAAIHVSPEALAGGPLAKLRDGDLIRLDAVAGTLDALVDAVEWAARESAHIKPDQAEANAHDLGRELFAGMRRNVSSAESGRHQLALSGTTGQKRPWLNAPLERAADGTAQNAAQSPPSPAAGLTACRKRGPGAALADGRILPWALLRQALALALSTGTSGQHSRAGGWPGPRLAGHGPRRVRQTEDRHGLHQLTGLGAQAFCGSRALFDQGRILLRGLVHLRDRVIDLTDAAGLLQARAADLAHDVGDPRDGLFDLAHRRPGPFHQGGALFDAFVARLDQRLDFTRCLRAALGQGAHFGCHDGESAALFAGARSLHGGVERQDVGLEGDAVDDADDVRDAV
jgi:hypothetical protein